MSLKKLKLSERIIDHLIQAILIFISVFLAFWLSQYQEKQETKRITQEVKNVIYQELSSNLREVEKNEAVHAKICAGLVDFYNTKLDTITQFSLWEMFDKTESIVHRTLPSGAVNLALDHRMELAPFIKARISLVYEEQKKVNEIYQKLFDNFLYSKERFDEKLVRENYLIFYGLLDKLWNREKVLISKMKEVVNLINN